MKKRQQRRSARLLVSIPDEIPPALDDVNTGLPSAESTAISTTHPFLHCAEPTGTHLFTIENLVGQVSASADGSIDPEYWCRDA
jgi:hypothetical protein